MLLLVTISLVCVILSLLYLRWRHARQYWAARGVPHEPPHPILGSLTFMIHQNAGIWLRNTYEKFNTKHQRTPYLGIWFSWKPALMVMCPDLIRRILIGDSTKFRNRHTSSSKSDPLGALNLFVVNDPLWGKIRKSLSPAFTSAKLKTLQPDMQTKANELVRRIESENGKRFDMRDMFADFTTDVIGVASFGTVSNATLTGEGPLRSVTKDFMAFSIYRGISWFCIFFIPEVVDFFGFTFFPKKATDYFRKLFKLVVSQRITGDRRTKKGDLLDALLLVRTEAAAEGEDYSEDLLIAQAAIFLQGGFDTTATALTFIMYELAYDRQVQDKAYAELVEAQKKSGLECLDSKVMEGLTYLNCVISESLRKYNAIAYLDRVAADHYRIDDKLVIKAGTPIVINSIGIHYDPEYFPDPYKFDPDRFLPENENSINPSIYMPFGSGPRHCIGMKFGQMLIRTALSTLLLKYTLELYPGSPMPNQVKIAKRGLTYAPGEVINIKFVPRL